MLDIESERKVLIDRSTISVCCCAPPASLPVALVAILIAKAAFLVL